MPYLNQFKEHNPGSEVHYVVIGHQIEDLFVYPSIMNASLQFARPVMSLDATHLKSYHNGTLYLATAKTGLNEIYTVAISIQRANECYDGWKMFLTHLKDACSLFLKG
jgi:hypothetical protein